MVKLEEKIRREGKVLPGNILKVSSFLNHKIDVLFMDEMAAEFVRLFKGCEINKVLTIESSGIAIACAVARLLKVPVVFCKKTLSTNVNEDVFSTPIHSFTHGRDYNVIVSKDFIGPDDKILIVDDFLANGCALEGLADLVYKAGAKVVGAGICIEMGFQDGGNKLREKGMKVESLAIVEKMTDDGQIEFRPQ